MYCQNLERRVHVLSVLGIEFQLLSDFGMDSSCTVSLRNGQCMYFHSLEWTVYVLSPFRMESA